MFTVKLYQGKHLKLVQTKMVDVYKERCKNGTIEVVTDEESYFIADPMRDRTASDPKDLYDCAYVENERGSTTQRITPKMVLA